MALNNIELFPEEILIKIFQFLSPKMLKTCCAVSKIWNTIIDSSKQLMENFKLELDSDKSTEYQAMPMRKNYQKIQINTKGMNRILINQALSVNSYTLYSLELQSCDLPLHEFANVLNNLPVLKILHLNFVMFNEDSTEDYETVKLKLTTLKIFGYGANTNENFFRILDVATLRQLSVSSFSNSDEDNIPNFKALIDFICQQDELEQLYLSCAEVSAFFNDLRILDMKFRLKQLDIRGRCIRNVENFYSFVSIHKDTLETLKLYIIDKDGPFQLEIYDYIWNNLSLKTIDATILKFDQEWDNLLVLNPELANQYIPKFPVESIKLYGLGETDFSAKYLNVLIASLASVKQLDLQMVLIIDIDLWINIIQHISNNMKNLTVLTMPFEYDLSILAAETIYFPKLEEMNITEINEDLGHFIRRHSKTLKKISFQWINQDFIDDILDEIFNCDNLNLISLKVEQPKILSMINTPSYTQQSDILRLFNRLNRRTRRSKEWHLIFRCMLGKFTYKFPDDIAYWNQNHRVWMGQSDAEFM